MYLHFGNPQSSSALKHEVIRIKVLSWRTLLSFVWSYFLFLRLWTISVKPSKKKKNTPFKLPGDPIWEGLRQKSEIFTTLMGTIIDFDWFAWFVFTFISQREMCMSKIITSTIILIWLFSFLPTICISTYFYLMKSYASCVLLSLLNSMLYIFSHVDFEVIFDS